MLGRGKIDKKKRYKWVLKAVVVRQDRLWQF